MTISERKALIFAVSAIVLIALLAIMVGPASAQATRTLNCAAGNGGGRCPTASVMYRDANGNAADVTATAPLPTAAVDFPADATPITASATGTTAATTATLAGTTGKTTYICGFSIRANATAAVTGNATITGTITGTLNFTQWTAPLASGLGEASQDFSRCIPASAVNTGIAVISAAPGSGGVVSVSAWGYQR